MGLSLRGRLLLVWLGVVVGACVSLTLLYTRANEDTFAAEFRRRLKVTAQLGSQAVDRVALRRLVDNMSLDVDEAKVREIEQSGDYKLVSQQLNALRNTDPTLIRFVYILRRIPDHDPRFIVDADVLSPHPPPPDEISHFNAPYTVDKLTMLSVALKDCNVQVESRYWYDEKFHVRSLSAYAPIKSGNECLGVLGVDVADTDARHVLGEARIVAWRNALIAIALALALGGGLIVFLTRPWVRVDAELAELARPYQRNDPESGSDVNRVARNLQRVISVCMTPTDSINRRMQDEVIATFGGPSTIERIRRDIVPEGTDSTVAGNVDHFARHANAVVLVADVSGMRRDSVGTSDYLGAWRELFRGYAELATNARFIHAGTSSGSGYLVASPSATTESVTNLIELGIAFASLTKRLATKAQLPFTVSCGVAIGTLVLRTTAKAEVVDMWGDVLLEARKLQDSCPANRIQISKSVHQLAKSIPARPHAAAEGEQIDAYIVESRTSQQLMKVGANAAEDHGE